MLDIARTLNEEGIAGATGALVKERRPLYPQKRGVHGDVPLPRTMSIPFAWRGVPTIGSKAHIRRVNGLMRSRAPVVSHPRMVGNPYVLSGLIKCYRDLSGHDSLRGRFHYYVCHSLMSEAAVDAICPGSTSAASHQVTQVTIEFRPSGCAHSALSF